MSLVKGVKTRKVVIAGSLRLPFARSGTNYATLSNLDMMSECLRALVQKFDLEGEVIGDVALGAVINHPKDWNLAREAVLRSGLAHETPAFGVQRACGTSLETAILLAHKIALGQIDSAIAGGVDSMSDVPVFYSKQLAQRILKLPKVKGVWDQLKIWRSLSLAELKPNFPAVTESLTNLSMGQSCELMAQHWKISREDQDQLAFESHKKAATAYESGFYNDLISPYQGLDKDNNMRADTTIEKLAKLKTAFEKGPQATLTAGNSTPLTDGAATVLLCSEEYAQKKGLPILAYWTDSEVAAVNFVEKEGLLMAPAYAVPRMLLRNEIKLQDFDFYEIHEAFAAQVLCTLKAWNDEDFCKNKVGVPEKLGSIDRSKLNVKGGSVALGHPFGATGARVLGTLAKLLDQKGSGRGLLSVCTGGGMGVTAIIEKP